MAVEVVVSRRHMYYVTNRSNVCSLWFIVGLGGGKANEAATDGVAASLREGSEIQPQGTGCSVVPYMLLMTSIRLFAISFWPSAEGCTPSKLNAVPKVPVGWKLGKGRLWAVLRMAVSVGLGSQ